MKHAAISGAAALLASLLVSVAWAQNAEKAGASNAATSAATKTAGKETTSSTLINGPETHFRAARTAFDKGDLGAAGHDIRQGAALIRIEANRSNITDETDLLTSAAELETLAGNVAQGSVSSPYDLSRAFARADLALARHYHMLAQESLHQKNTKEAAVWLGAATDYVNDSVAWNSRQLEESGSPVVKKMRALQKSLQEKISAGTQAASQETARGLDALGKDLQQLAQKISP